MSRVPMGRVTSARVVATAAGRQRVGLTLVLLLSLACGATVLAQSRGERIEPLPAVSSLLSEPLASLEQQIARLAQTRADAPAAQLPYLEFQVDVRVLASWLCEQAMAAKPDSESQPVLYLRAQDALALVVEIDRWVAANVNNPLSRTQSESMIRLRQMTYRLGKADSLALLDATLRSIAENLAGALSPTPLAGRLPAMRPVPFPATRPSVVEPVDGGVTPSLTLPQLAEKVRQMSISPVLRKQVLALVQAAQNAADDANESAALRSALDVAIELASGLQTNVAVAAEDRLRLEQSLADALSLYADPRTRAAGDRRLKSLNEYRKLLSRVLSLSLPRDVMATLAPALVFARENPDRGGVILDAIETFARETARFDSRKASAPLPENYRRGFEDLQRQFAQQRQAFLAAAATVGDRSVFRESIESLTTIAAELRRINELLEAIVQMPSTLDRLAVYKVRPAGALEKRVVTAIVQASNPQPSDPRKQASDFLLQLGRLQSAAQRLSDTIAEIPADAGRTWFGDKVAEIERSVRQRVAEIASIGAEGNPLPSGDIARLERGIDLIASITSAARIETALPKTEALQRWADWRASPAGLQAVLAPLRQSASSAIDSWLAGDAQAIDRFYRRRQRFVPLLRLIERSVPYAEQCGKLPTDLAGLLARFGTPSHQQPFAAQRLASMGIDLLLHRAATDPNGVDSAFTALSQRLARELRD